MKKLLFGISLILFNTPVLAQTNVLFPELQGQFKVTQPVEQPQPIVSEEPTDIPKEKLIYLYQILKTTKNQYLKNLIYLKIIPYPP